MIRMAVIGDNRVLQAIEQELADSPRKVGEIAQKVSASAPVQALLVALKTEPPKPSYPLRWKSKRQRRFVMAKLRRANQIPYSRTHDLVRSWQVKTFIPSLGIAQIIILNSSPVAAYVQGQYQQPYHIDTGWKNVQDVVPRYVDPIVGQYLQEWNDVFNT